MKDWRKSINKLGGIDLSERKTFCDRGGAFNGTSTQNAVIRRMFISDPNTDQHTTTK